MKPSSEIAPRTIKRRRHMRGSLRLESGRTWVVRYLDVDRHERRLTFSKADFPTKAAAERERDRRMAVINPGLSRDARSITVKDFASVYETDAIALMKPTAARSAHSLLHRYVVPVLGALYLEDVKGRWPQQLVNVMREQGLSNKTISNALVVVSRMLKLARHYECPCADFARWMIKMPPVAPTTPRRCFTPDEAVQIIEAAEWPWCVLFALHGHCGFRRGEGLGFTWEDINFDSRVIHVRRAVILGQIATVKSARSRRDIAMSQPLFELLTAYRARWVPNERGLLFTNKHGQPINGDYVNTMILTPLLRRMGIPHGGLHGFRHGHSTNLLAQGISVKIAMDLMGHADIDTTVSYAHVVQDDQRRAQEKVSALLVGESRRNEAAETQQNKADQ